MTVFWKEIWYNIIGMGGRNLSSFNQKLTHKMSSFIPLHSESLSIEMDDFTACLVHRPTGETYSTSVEPLEKSDVKQLAQNGWSEFNWDRELNDRSRKVYKLLVNGDERIHGVISYEILGGYVYIHLIESAPWNIGTNTKEFVGVGPHLVSIACKESFQHGFEGYVCFLSKSNLVEHYRKSLNAFLIGGLKMAIETNDAKKLVDIYFS
jgi:hypothetical protein